MYIEINGTQCCNECFNCPVIYSNVLNALEYTLPPKVRVGYQLRTYCPGGASMVYNYLRGGRGGGGT